MNRVVCQRCLRGARDLRLVESWERVHERLGDRVRTTAATIWSNTHRGYKLQHLEARSACDEALLPRRPQPKGSTLTSKVGYSYELLLLDIIPRLGVSITTKQQISRLQDFKVMRSLTSLSEMACFSHSRLVFRTYQLVSSQSDFSFKRALSQTGTFLSESHNLSQWFH